MVRICQFLLLMDNFFVAVSQVTINPIETLIQL